MAAALAGMAFIPYYKHLMKLLDTSADLKKTSKGIFKQMAWAAGGSCAGGVVGGPPGALIGGIAGAMYGYFKSSDYDSMVNVVRNLTDRDKEMLVKKIQELVGSSTIEALTSFIGSQVQRELLINCIQSVLQNKGGG